MAEDVPWYMRRRTRGAETFHLIIYIFIDFSILYFPVRGLVLSSWRITLLAMEEMVSWLFETLVNSKQNRYYIKLTQRISFDSEARTISLQVPISFP